MISVLSVETHSAFSPLHCVYPLPNKAERAKFSIRITIICPEDKAMAEMKSLDFYSLPIELIDVSDPELFESYTYHPLFRRLRAEDPVHYFNSEEYGPFWSVTKYDDIVHVEKNHKIFSSAEELGGIAIQDSQVRRVIDSGASFITMDPPRHGKHRGMVKGGFTPGNLAKLEVEIRERVKEIVSSLPVGETFDWVGAVSNELPIQMLAILFGIPQADRGKFLRWSNVVIGLDDPEVVESDERARAELMEFAEYCFWLWNERTREPGNDLVTMIVHNPDAKDMQPLDYISTMILLTVGGNDTTRNSITGGLYQMTQNPDQYDMIRKDRDMIPAAVNEMIRWQSPVAHMRRTALEDTELRGRQINVFDAPDTFNIKREGPRHLSFGIGIHYCIGARLAELQLKWLWEELLDQHPVIEAMGSPVRLRSNFISGIKSLSVRIQP
jgi:cytochrome P450